MRPPTAKRRNLPTGDVSPKAPDNRLFEVPCQPESQGYLTDAAPPGLRGPPDWQDRAESPPGIRAWLRRCVPAWRARLPNPRAPARGRAPIARPFRAL